MCLYPVNKRNPVLHLEIFGIVTLRKRYWFLVVYIIPGSEWKIQWIRFYRWLVLKQSRHEDSCIIHRCHSCFRGDWIFILEWLTLTCQIPATCHRFKCVCGSPQLPVKTQARVLYNFPIFPAPCVLNCIGRWIFGIRGCQVSTKEDFMHWYTRYESEFCRDGGESKSWVKCCHYSSSGHFSLSDW